MYDIVAMYQLFGCVVQSWRMTCAELANESPAASGIGSVLIFPLLENQASLHG